MRFFAMTLSLIIALSFGIVSGTFARSISDAEGILGTFSEKTGLPEGTVTGQTSSAINVVLSLVGIIFFVLCVYAGFVWMTAQGDEEKISNARNTLITAVIGMSLTVGAYGITSFVVNELSSQLSGGGDGARAPGTGTDAGGNVVGDPGCCVDLVSERGGVITTRNFAGYPATQSVCQAQESSDATGPRGDAWEWYSGAAAQDKCSQITRCWNFVVDGGNRKTSCLSELGF